MTLTFSKAKYSDLLTKVTPKVIETEQEYKQTLATIEELTFKQNRTPEETAVYQLLVVLVESYENENFPMPEVPPHAVLQHILEASGTCQSDLVGVLGSGEVVSRIIEGVSPINETQAKILADLFKVSPSLFT